MAYNYSGDLAIGASYKLGGYTFTLQTTISEGERVIQAHISGQEGNAAKGISVPSSQQVQKWYVAATDTIADVYVTLAGRDTTVREVDLSEVGSFSYSFGPWAGLYWPNIAVYADFPAKVYFSGLDAQTLSPITLTYNVDKDIYSGNIDINGYSRTPDYGPVALNYTELLPQGHASTLTVGTKLVARFSIDIKEAGGGPGGSIDTPEWDEPGDIGDPSYTLYVDVTGALSGRHNDPLNDTSYSYIPSDKATERPYGSGGDGGHGGGGGGGASTVVVHKIATDRAGHTNVIAKARRHGYGSGGGKGGKGGMGTILIYY